MGDEKRSWGSIAVIAVLSLFVAALVVGLWNQIQQVATLKQEKLAARVTEAERILRVIDTRQQAIIKAITPARPPAPVPRPTPEPAPAPKAETEGE